MVGDAQSNALFDQRECCSLPSYICSEFGVLGVAFQELQTAERMIQSGMLVFRQRSMERLTPNLST